MVSTVPQQTAARKRCACFTDAHKGCYLQGVAVGRTGSGVMGEVLIGEAAELPADVEPEEESEGAPAREAFQAAV